MQKVKIHRLFLEAQVPIVSPMKTTLYRYPTSEELRALEFAARRARAREVARLFRAGAAGLKGLFERIAAHPGAGRIGHA